METVGSLLKERYERIVVENEFLRAGFAAVPYLVLRDTRLSTGSRLASANPTSMITQSGRAEASSSISSCDRSPAAVCPGEPALMRFR